MPITPFIGVRISWLMLARNSLFARLAASAASRACRSSSSARLCAVMSLYVDTKPPPRMGLSWISRTRWLGAAISIRLGWNWRALATRSAACAAGSPGPYTPRSATMRRNSSRGRPTHPMSSASRMMRSARLFQAARRSSPSNAIMPCPMLSSVVSSSADFSATSVSRRCRLPDVRHRNRDPGDRGLEEGSRRPGLEAPRPLEWSSGAPELESQGGRGAGAEGSSARPPGRRDSRGPGQAQARLAVDPRKTAARSAPAEALAMGDMRHRLGPPWSPPARPRKTAAFR